MYRISQFLGLRQLHVGSMRHNVPVLISNFFFFLGGGGGMGVGNLACKKLFEVEIVVL